MKLLFANFISFLPFAQLIFILLNHLLEILNITKVLYYDLIYVIGFVLTLICTDILKQIFFPLFKAAARPSMATGCDFFSIKGNVGGQPGFPSGHMSITAYFAIFNILLIVNRNHGSKYWKTLLILSNIVIIILMGWARHFKHCHNMIQILGGIITGTILGIGFFYLSKQYSNKIDIKQNN